MAERVILHIGPPKTGSTYVQSVLWSQPAPLAQLGVALPLGSPRRQWHAAASLCGDRWGHLADAAESTWDRFAAAARESSGTAVLSDENLARATDDQISRAVESLAPAEVHVVLAARQLSRLVPSVWQQEVRTRETRTLAEFADDIAADPGAEFWQMQDSAALVQRWGARVPPARLHVLTVPRQGGAALWHRFCDVLDLAHDAVPAGERTENPSMSTTHAEMLRRVNVSLGDRLPMQDPYIRAIRHGLVAAMADGAMPVPPSQLIALDDERRAWAEGRTARLVTELRELGVRPVGTWDDLLLAEPVGTDAAGSEVDEPMIAAAAVDSLAAFAVRFDDRARQVAEREHAVAGLRAELDETRARLAMAEQTLSDRARPIAGRTRVGEAGRRWLARGQKG